MSRSCEETDDKQLATIDDSEMLGEDLVSELQAINQYHGHASALENEEAVTTPEHIVEGERERVAELLRLIQNVDPVQAHKFREIL